MLAGVSGIDLVLFVIASDESIKPQTREHFDICMLLGIRKGIVVLTKADLAGGRSAGAGQAGSGRICARFVSRRCARGGGQLGHRRGPGRTARRDCEEWPLRFPKRMLPNISGCPLTALSPCAALAPWSPARSFRASCAWSRKWSCIRRASRVRVRGIQVHGSAVEQATAGTANRVELGRRGNVRIRAWDDAG